jgi:F-type H+-transporting ATPase subunit delta
VSSDVIGATGLAGRYATALFELAEADKQLNQVADDLLAIAQMLEKSDDLKRLIRSPVISRDNQGVAMAAVMEAAKAGELSRKFIGLVAQNRRLFVLPAMIKAYQALIKVHRGETTAEVVSAKKLSAKQLKGIEDALKNATGTNVSVDASVDDSLLGGLIVKVGSRMVDSSLKTKLDQLRFSMKGVG